MKNFILFIGLLAFVFSCDMDFDLEPEISTHQVRGKVTDISSGLLIEGIPIRAHECEFCLIGPCDKELYGDVTSAYDGTFEFSYLGESCMELSVRSEWVTVVDSNGIERQLREYTQYVLFGDTSLAYVFPSYHSRFDSKFFDIKMIRNPDLEQGTSQTILAKMKINFKMK